MDDELGDVTGHANEDCNPSVSGSTPDIASEQERREIAYENRGQVIEGSEESVRPKLFERPPGNVYEFNSNSEIGRAILEDDGPPPYCPSCDRYPCRRPISARHKVIYPGDERYPVPPQR